MELAFYLSALVAVLATVGVIAGTNAVHAVVYLIVSLIAVALVFFALGAPFAGALEIIVYAGAILVLYLFVVMLLNVKRDERYHAQYPLGALLGVTILTEVLLLVVQHSFSRDTATADLGASDGTRAIDGNTETIGEALYSTYLFPFEVASLILLVAMIGAIILAKRDLFENVHR